MPPILFSLYDKRACALGARTSRGSNPIEPQKGPVVPIRDNDLTAALHCGEEDSPAIKAWRAELASRNFELLLSIPDCLSEDDEPAFRHFSLAPSPLGVVTVSNASFLSSQCA